MGCAGNQCCYSELDDISICEHIMGLGAPGTDTSDHLECWVAMVGAMDAAGQFCQGCDTGCHAAIDTPSVLIRISDSDHGRRFLRRHPGSAHNLDARGRRHDLVSNEPVLINYVSNYQLGAGFKQGISADAHLECFNTHPCELWPALPCTDVPELHRGFINGGFFYNGNGFPMRTGSQRADLYCRKFTDTNLDRTIFVQLRDYQTHFARFGAVGTILGLDGWEGNWLVPCAAAVAGGSECDFLEGTTPSGCAGINRETAVRYTTGQCGTIYDEVRISENTAEFRVHNYLGDEEKRRVELKNAVLETIANEVLGSTLQPNQQVSFDRLDHQGGAAGSNQFLGQYGRSFDGPALGLELHELPKVADLEHSVTRFGGCLVNAQLVIVRCHMAANIYLHHKTRRSPQIEATTITHTVTPHIVFEISAELTIRGTLDGPDGPDGDPCQINGSDVVLAFDPTFAHFPTVSPQTNAIQYAGAPGAWVNPPRRVSWFGQLNHFSDPASETSDVAPSSTTEQGYCRAVAVAAGTIIVPGAASSSDFHPDDRNRHYDGQIGLRFDATTGFNQCGG